MNLLLTLHPRRLVSRAYDGKREESNSERNFDPGL